MASTASSCSRHTWRRRAPRTHAGGAPDRPSRTNTAIPARPLPSEPMRTQLLLSLAAPQPAAAREASLRELLSSTTVWHAEEWDPAWRAATADPAVRRAIGRAVRLAASDFVCGAHVPREAGEQLRALPWPERRSDFLAFPMMGFCHATAAVAFALASAVHPDERWVVLVSTAHATVFSLTSGKLVDFASAALGELVVQTLSDGREVRAKDCERDYVTACGIASLKQMVLATTEWAAYPSLDLYIEGVRASSPLVRTMPTWANPNGCDLRRYQQLVASGELSEAFARGDALRSVAF
ncbi:hypothetical protein AB1Y20_002165 [Prymnesium parvum]|uniref:MmgE/PrpD family protein n=1 Tax=Prymnesium parvum TaxID=97485 RepID=A0AB34JAG9_PRYPA